LAVQETGQCDQHHHVDVGHRLDLVAGDDTLKATRRHRGVDARPSSVTG
jgi:hypothetical protein